MIIPQDSLSLLVNSSASVVDYHLLIDNLLNLLMFDSNNIYSHGLDCTSSLGFFMKTLVSYLWTKLRKTMLYLFTQLPDL